MHRASSCQVIIEQQPPSIFLPSFWGRDAVPRASEAKGKRDGRGKRKRQA